MRGLGVGISGLVVAGLLLACGGSEKKAKSADDAPPSTQDETPKWEGAASPHPDDNPPPKSSSSGGAVHEAPTKRSDQYDKEGTEVALKRAARQVKANCGAAKGEDGKAAGPWGKATVTVRLGHNGHSQGVTVPEPYAGKPVGVCVEKSFTNLQFPPWQGQDAEVQWDVEIVKP
jgi:hypothetical protein